MSLALAEVRKRDASLLANVEIGTVLHASSSPFTPVGTDLGVDESAAYHGFIEYFDTLIRKEVKDESKIPVKTDRAEPC
jgi:hypothetical protein